MKVILLGLALIIGMTNALSADEVAYLRTLIVTEFEEAALAEAAAGAVVIHANLVRQSFHDCVGECCDGIINMDNDSNKGLNPAIDFTTNMLASAAEAGISISRADMIALEGQFGAEWGMEGMPGNKNFRSGGKNPDNADDFVSPFPAFKFGRSDGADGSVMNTFPEPTMTHTEVFDFFEKDFIGHLDPVDVVALMGAHTVGQCINDNSNYHGPWLPGKDTYSFDNTYYTIMFDTASQYLQTPSRPNQVFPQYDCTAIDDPDSKCGIMLNTDFEMCYDLTLDPDTKLATCMGSDTVYASPTTDCVRADTCTFVDTFRGDNTAFITAYVTAYGKMTENINDLCPFTTTSGALETVA